MSRRADQLALGTLLAAAVWLLGRLVLRQGAAAQLGLPAYDAYTFDIPNLFYLADRVLHHGGRGLLWNPLQDCGQPFLGLGTTAALYPPTALLLPFGADNAYRALLFYPIAVGALGAFYLGRRLGLGRIAAVCGGLAFAFSNAGVDAVTSGPAVGCPFAWLPAAVCCVEGILAAPTWRRAGVLAVVVAPIFVGHPQFVVFLCQVVLLRVVWEMLSRRKLLEYRALGALAVGFTVAPVLAAAHLLPVIETMGTSIHAGSLTLQELDPYRVDWKAIRLHFAARSELFDPFALVPFMLASAAAWGDRRRIVLFYLLAWLVFFDLGLGRGGHLFSYYTELPGGRLFHYPDRFLWVTVLFVSVLTAVGTQTILTPGARPTATRRWAILGGMAAMVGLVALLGHGLRPHEWVLVAIVLLATIAVFQRPAAYAAAGTALVAALILELVVLRPLPVRRLLPNSEVLFAQSQVFRLLAERMTSQERIYFVPKHWNFSLERKTPSLFGVPSLDDYNPVVSRRYAEFLTMLRLGRPMQGLNDSIFTFEGYMRPTMGRRLLDVAAARYVVTPASEDATHVIRDPPLIAVANLETVRVYENPSARPRARWVPRVEIVRDDQALLRRLAGLATQDDRTIVPHQLQPTADDLALVEDLPPSGFLGEAGAASTASVTFVRDDPEDIVVAVDAPRRGFLVLADQYARGWRATVNDVARPIVRADYAFRLVEVPAGHATVAFRYRPVSLFTGVAVSTMTLVVLVILLAAGRRRGEP